MDACSNNEEKKRVWLCFSLFVPYDALQCPVEGTFILLPKNKFTSVLSSSWFKGKISTLPPGSINVDPAAFLFFSFVLKQ